MPPMATIAKRPFFNSFNCISLALAASLGIIPKGSKPKLPGSLSNSFILLRAPKLMASIKLIQSKICFMEVSRRASWASRTLGMASKEKASPGMRTNSGTTIPTTASMAWRPCLSSASRNQLIHSGARSEKPAGSKFLAFFSPTKLKGMGSGPSPPTKPLAKALSWDLAAPVEGAMKADAVEAVRASTAAIFMVGCCCVLELTGSFLVGL
mmetsp:Transcript_15895/g.34356  ORF Transcript_15895/g.34356 Transcript_15895/m.34356 type:complete len:210 (+) Transcript_15895:448-1077(+)